MNDDQMDEMLIEGVRDYNTPDATPRDQMWKRISEGRAAAKANAARRAEPAAVASRTRRYFWPGIGVAAALILSVGIAIGRQMNRAAVAPAAGPTSSVAVVPVGPVVVTPNVDSATPASATAKTRDSLIHELHEQTNSTGRRVRELASAGPSSGRATSEQRTNQSLAYRLVVLQHLTGSEAMITSFRSGARSGEMDAQLAGWAKDLLSTTRLLEASQAGDDPMMKRLLGDLDLVISQIVQYTTRGTTDSDELDLIEQSINKRGVLSTLRSTINSRPTAGL